MFCDQSVFKKDCVTRYSLKNALYRAFVDARQGKRGTEDEIRFEVNLFDNLDRLTESIMKRKYKPSSGIAFTVSDPVVREIFAAPFRDRVVHHLLYNLCYKWWDKRFIGNSFSCRIGKGTIYGWKRLQLDMRRCSNMGRIPSTVAKFDLSGYFMSLNRKLLYDHIVWGLERQFKDAPQILSLTKYLWHEVIFDDPTKGVRIRGTPHDWRRLPRSKSLFFQPDGVGIVIGNLTSQLLSNIYLDLFDRYVKIELGYRYYGRYVDDFYIVIHDEDKKRLSKDREKIDRYLRSLGLKLHPKKCYIQPVEHGMEFLGAKVYLRHVQPGNRVRRNFHRTVHNVASGISGNFEAITSYVGIYTHFNAENDIVKTFDKIGWDYVLVGGES